MSMSRSDESMPSARSSSSIVAKNCASRLAVMPASTSPVPAVASATGPGWGMSVESIVATALTGPFAMTQKLAEPTAHARS